MIIWALFAVLSVILAILSRRSLGSRGSHGFFRFLAWEAILGLVLMNAPVWFHDPIAWHQIISWILLVVSGLLVLEGVRLLHGGGKPDKQRRDATLFVFEKTTSLVTTGIYRYIRHPLYSSLVFLGWGAFFKDPDLVPGVLAVLATGFLMQTARVEEAECVRYFGDAYLQYMRTTKRFLPFVL